ncbi:hypothetical protein M4R22_10975 [Acidovorax sp. GBBC 3334]|uniref:hypothetical protein n=1 Tax=Acidovorax sp. GBBC 3334 TaxID=2940496 RepID=UPI002302E557|nr:hypothetical protein [Acidovorax sp. GBBC 3334]MDA8455284.1 hypothetical protein [Acidovorax sp. GBBC 3334]
MEQNHGELHDAHVAAYASYLVRSENVARLMELRDEYVQIATEGRFVSAAAKEWRELPRTWRMTLLLVAGVGVDTCDLDTLAARAWQELPEPEQREVRWVVRDAKRRLGGLTALAARV